jgi:hypothetical protein
VSEFTYSTDCGLATIRFPAKPAPQVLAILKGSGFRWSRDGYWWRTKISGFAEVLQALRGEVHGPELYKCWTCDQQGPMRRYAARTWVACDACYAKQQEAEAAHAARLAADDFDLANNRSL